MTKTEIKLINALNMFTKHFGPLEHVPEPHPDVIAAFDASREAIAFAEKSDKENQHRDAWT